MIFHVLLLLSKASPGTVKLREGSFVDLLVTRYYLHPTPVMRDVTEAALTTGSWADINNADTNISAADRRLLGGLPPL